jgi:hypothetical protein
LAFDQGAGTPPSLTVAFSSWLRRGRRAWLMVASTIGPPMARSPASRSTASKRRNDSCPTAASVSRARNSQMVSASGTRSAGTRPQNRMHESRSFNRYSV